MPRIPGYTVAETVRGDKEILLFRGRRESDSLQVLIETTVLEHSTPESLERLDNEYALKEELDSAWALQPIEQVRVGDRTALIFADPGGETLERILAQPLELTESLRFAIGVSASLEQLHRRNIIHKDIKPANIQVDIATGTVRLTGFGIASRLPRERMEPEPPEGIAGTLAYMAPEQTGRMNRSIDSRSDLYSLGVTLYELFTGSLPFSAKDPMEWVHCHIARIPIPPTERAKNLPLPISNVVMKLLTKTAEERYQTAKGVEADLRRCLEEWETLGRIAPFPLGAHDASGRLLIPETLYGREAETRNLLEAFGRVETTGIPEFVFVSGYSGIGKSSLVNELHKALLLPRSLFASGKFDQYKRDVPYDTFAQAFKTLVRKILAMKPEEVDLWREHIREAVGPNGQLMVGLIPELEFILGKQPPVPELFSQEAQNRFHEVFRKFLGAFARQEHPLVLFLDDLQWMDPASLKLFEYVATHPEVRHLLLIGAYRDNEVNLSHPLMLTLESVFKNPVHVNTIVLKPLSLNDIQLLVADSLHCDGTQAEPLARLVQEKTGGNPFFAIQFLNGLYDERLLEFEAKQEAWTWDVGRIRARNFADNVVDLMVGKLERLPEPTVNALKGMACVGTAMDIATLTKVLGGTEQQSHADLWDAILAGLVFRVGDTYKFLHDRVREGAYTLIPENLRAGEHLRIGRLLVSNLKTEAVEEQVFTLLNQFNRGIGMVTDPVEKEFIRGMNVAAGRKAKAAIAYASANIYLSQANALLPEDAWNTNYEETLSLTLNLSECEYLVGRFESADELFDLILGKARTLLDRLMVYRLRIKLYQSVGRFRDAIKVGFEGLGFFGITFPESDPEIEADVAKERREFPVNLRGRRIADLADAPVVADPDARAIIELFGELTAPVYITKPKMLALLLLKGTNFCLRHGNTEDSCSIYIYFAAIQVDLFEDIPLGFEFSELALRLNAKFKDAKLRGKLLLNQGALIQFWRKPFATCIPILQDALIACMNSGDLVNAGYTAYLIVWQQFATGIALDEVVASLKKAAAFAKQTRNEPIHQLIRHVQQHIASLKGLTRGPADFEDDGFNEAESLAIVAQAGVDSALEIHLILKQVSTFHFGRYEEALDFSVRAEPNLVSLRAGPMVATYIFYYALTLAALIPGMPEERRQEYARALDEKVKKLKFWADHCPENFLSCHALASAEVARIEGRDLEAMRLYDRAIASARQNGFMQNESLGHELAGKFYLDRGFDTTARAYLLNARAGYLRWGALGKVKQLDQRYPGLEAQSPVGGTATLRASPEQLDLMTVVKASQAVSGEIVLGTLVEKLLAIMVEHAGAEKGLLILFQDGEQILEAEATTQGDKIEVRFRHAPVTPADLPESLLHFTQRTRERILLEDASAPNPYSDDEYIRRVRPRSILCLPLVKQTKLVALLYLENNLTPRAFTPGRIAVLDVLASQAAISLENARLYDGLQKENAERKRAEERFSKAFHSSPSPMAISRIKDDAFVDANAKFLETFEYAREEFLGSTAVKLGIADADAVEKALKLVSESGSFHDVEFRVKTKSGAPRTLLVSIESIEIEGEPCLLTTYLDMTERKKVEAQLRQSQKMEAIGRLAGGVAHDFNNLLTAINGYSSLALAIMDPASPAYVYVRETLKAGDKAAGLTRQLLAHSRKQIMRPLVWDLNVIVEEMAPMLRRLIGEDVNLVTSLGPDTGKVMVDRGQTEQIILNLVVNARDAMPQGGTLNITTSSAYLDPTYLGIHLEAVPGPHIVLSVSDTGTGMTPEVKARLFEPFFTTKEEGKGTGLGLSVVYGIVKQSGGSIFVYSEEGMGTTFRIYLPEAKGETEAARGPRLPERPESYRGSETILLVEDSESVRRFAGIALEAKGYKVLEAGNGVEALKVLEDAASIDLVLSDVVMPIMGGAVLAQHLRELFPSLPVVFLSGFTEHPMIDGKILNEEEDILQKPFSPFELAKKVREVLDRAGKRAEAACIP